MVCNFTIMELLSNCVFLTKSVKYGNFDTIKRAITFSFMVFCGK